MPESNWIKLATYSSVNAAELAAEKLDGHVPSEILDGLDQPVTQDHIGPCYLWVPGAQADEASFALGEPAASEEDLEKMALASPPPDDAKSIVLSTLRSLTRATT